MADDESTAVQKRSKSKFAEKVRMGANLPEEQWNDVRVAAAMRQLPTRFQDLPSTIAYLSRAKRSGLDPFMEELWAWEDKRGNLQFMTSRDGWLKLANADDDVEGVEFGLVYENDDFSIRKEGGDVFVTHNVEVPRGDLLGAYCAVHMAEPDDDHFDWREMQDYSHLMGKTNWKNHPKDMLQNRVISAALRVKCPAGANLYSPEDFIMEEDGDRYAREEVGGSTDARADALADELETESAIEAEVTEEHPGKEDDSPTESSDDDAGSSTEASDTAGEEPDPAPEPEPEATTEPCPICTEPLTPKQRGGHMGGHSRAGIVDEEIRALLGKDFRVAQDEDGFYVMDPGGALHGDGPDNRPFNGWKPALKAMKAVARDLGMMEDPHADEDDGRPDVPDWLVDEDYGTPQDVTVLDESTPAGYAVLKAVYGAGQVRYQANKVVADAEGWSRFRPVGELSAGRTKALAAIEEDIDDADQQDEPEPEAEPADEDDWTAGYKACVQALEQGGRAGDMNLLYDLAEKLFPDAVDDEKGKVQMTELSGTQLHDLADEITDHLI